MDLQNRLDQNLEKFLRFCEKVRSHGECITDEDYITTLKILNAFGRSVIKEYINEYFQHLMDAVNIIIQVIKKSSCEIVNKFFAALINKILTIVTQTKINERNLTKFLTAFQEIQDKYLNKTDVFTMISLNYNSFKEFFHYMKVSASYQTQVVCTDFFVRFYQFVTAVQKREIAEVLIPEDYVCSRAMLMDMSMDQIDLKCRSFLMAYNSEAFANDQICNVYSLIAEDIVLGDMCLPRPKVDSYDRWIDFNFYSSTITFFCESNIEDQWIYFEIKQSNFKHAKIRRIGKIVELAIELNYAITNLPKCDLKSIDECRMVRLQFQRGAEMTYFVNKILPTFVRKTSINEQAHVDGNIASDSTGSKAGSNATFNILRRAVLRTDKQVDVSVPEVVEIVEPTPKPQSIIQIHNIHPKIDSPKTPVRQPDVPNPLSNTNFKAPKRQPTSRVTRTPKSKKMSTNMKNSMKENISPSCASQTTRKRSLFKMNLNDVEVKSHDSRDSQVRLTRMRAARRNINFVQPSVHSVPATTHSKEDIPERNPIPPTIDQVIEIIDEDPIEPQPIIDVVPEPIPEIVPETIFNEVRSEVNSVNSTRNETVQEPLVYLSDRELVNSTQYYMEKVFDSPPKNRFSQSVREKCEANFAIINSMAKRSAEHFFPPTNKPSIHVYDFEVDPNETPRPKKKGRPKKAVPKKVVAPFPKYEYKVPHRDFHAPVKVTENKNAIFSYRAAARKAKNIVQPISFANRSEQLFDALNRQSIDEIEVLPDVNQLSSMNEESNDRPVTTKPKTLGKTDLAKRLEINERLLYPVVIPVAKKRSTYNQSKKVQPKKGRPSTSRQNYKKRSVDVSFDEPEEIVELPRTDPRRNVEKRSVILPQKEQDDYPSTSRQNDKKRLVDVSFDEPEEIVELPRDGYRSTPRRNVEKRSVILPQKEQEAYPSTSRQNDRRRYPSTSGHNDRFHDQEQSVQVPWPQIEHEVQIEVYPSIARDNYQKRSINDYSSKQNDKRRSIEIVLPQREPEVYPSTSKQNDKKRPVETCQERSDEITLAEKEQEAYQSRQNDRNRSNDAYPSTSRQNDKERSVQVSLPQEQEVPSTSRQNDKKRSIDDYPSTSKQKLQKRSVLPERDEPEVYPSTSRQNDKKRLVEDYPSTSKHIDKKRSVEPFLSQRDHDVQPEVYPSTLTQNDKKRLVEASRLKQINMKRPARPFEVSCDEQTVIFNPTRTVQRCPEIEDEPDPMSSFAEKQPFIENWVSKCASYQTGPIGHDDDFNVVEANSYRYQPKKVTFKTVGTSTSPKRFKSMATSPIDFDANFSSTSPVGFKSMATSPIDFDGNVSSTSSASSVKSASSISITKRIVKKLNFGRIKEERVVRTGNPLQEIRKVTKTTPIVRDPLKELTERFKSNLRESLTNVLQKFGEKLTNVKNGNYSEILKNYKKYRTAVVGVHEKLNGNLEVIGKHEKKIADESKNYFDNLKEVEGYNNKFFEYLHSTAASIKRRSNEALEAYDQFSQEVSKQAVVVRKNVWNTHLSTTAQRIQESILKYAA